MAVKIIRIVNPYKLADVITDEPVACLRKLLRDANMVQAGAALGPILDQTGAVDKERIEDALIKLTSLLTKAIKDPKAKHGAGRRARISLQMNVHKDPAV
jgi:hypothetical protein